MPLSGLTSGEVMAHQRLLVGNFRDLRRRFAMSGGVRGLGG